MKCPKCQFENRKRVRFCEQCGAKMDLVCPHCGSTVPFGSKFCGECGHKLAIQSEPSPKELSFDQKLDKIQRYLPEGLSEKIISKRDKIEGERKQVTLMFCDMEGFTPLVVRLGPEEAYSIMDQVYEILIHKVHDYEGTVNEMTGDGIMALFGAPIALEDAPQRAVRSALAIHREMARFNDTVKQEQKAMPPLKIRIGINTGPVVVGKREGEHPFGQAVVIASRILSRAKGEHVLISDVTKQLALGGGFSFLERGRFKPKGFKESVKLHEVLWRA